MNGWRVPKSARSRYSQSSAEEQPRGPDGSAPRHQGGSPTSLGQAGPELHPTGRQPPTRCRAPPEPEAPRPNLRSLNGTHVSLPQEAAHSHFRPPWTMGLVVTGCVGRCRKGRRRGRGGRAACWECVGPAWRAGSPEGRRCTWARARLRPAAAGVSGDVRPTPDKKAASELPFAFAGAAARPDRKMTSPASSLAERLVTSLAGALGARRVAPGGFWVAGYPRPPRVRLPFPA